MQHNLTVLNESISVPADFPFILYLIATRILHVQQYTVLHLIDQLITPISFMYTHPCDYYYRRYNYFKCQINGGYDQSRIFPPRFQKSTCLRKFTKKGSRIIPHVEHDRSHRILPTTRRRLSVSKLRFSPNRKKERERKKNREREKKTKQKYERWIIKIPLSGENDALEHECCSSLHHRSRFCRNLRYGRGHRA